MQNLLNVDAEVHVQTPHCHTHTNRTVVSVVLRGLVVEQPTYFLAQHNQPPTHKSVLSATSATRLSTILPCQAIQQNLTAVSGIEIIPIEVRYS